MCMGLYVYVCVYLHIKDPLHVNTHIQIQKLEQKGLFKNSYFHKLFQVVVVGGKADHEVSTTHSTPSNVPHSYLH